MRGSPAAVWYGTPVTPAMTSRWSPAVTSRSAEHSSAVRPPSGISAPDAGPRRCGTSSSISRAAGRPEAANRPASTRCPPASSVTANRVTGSSGRLNSSAGEEPDISDTSTSGGSADTGQNALTVAPISSRPSATVTSVTAPAHAARAESQPSGHTAPAPVLAAPPVPAPAPDPSAPAPTPAAPASMPFTLTAAPHRDAHDHVYLGVICGAQLHVIMKRCRRGTPPPAL